MNPRARSRMLPAAVAALGILTALAAAWPVYRAFLACQLDGSEGWNAFHAAAAMGSDALYPPRDRLVTNNYPPLSFYVVGVLGRLVGDTVLAGRLLGLLSLAFVAICAALAVRLLGGSRLGAGVGALFFVATMTRFNSYVGTNNPQFLAHAIMSVGFVWFLRAPGGGSIPAVLIMVVAGFVKHNIVAMPVAALARAALGDLRAGLRQAAVGATAVVGGLAACRLVYGPDFLANMLAPRVYDWGHAIAAVGHLQWVAVPLGIWGYWAWTMRGDRAARFTALYIGIAVACFFIQKTGAGVVVNAQFDLVIAVSIGLGLAISGADRLPLATRCGPDGLRATFILLIFLRLLAATRPEAVRLVFDPSFRADLAARHAIALAEVARVRSIPGAVACDIYIICQRAGKPFVFEAFNTSQRVLTGDLTTEEVTRRMAERRIIPIAIDPRAMLMDVDWRRGRGK